MCVCVGVGLLILKLVVICFVIPVGKQTAMLNVVCSIGEMVVSFLGGPPGKERSTAPEGMKLPVCREPTEMDLYTLTDAGSFCFELHLPKKGMW